MKNDKTTWNVSIMAIMRFIIRKPPQRAKKLEKDVIDIAIDRKRVDICEYVNVSITYEEYMCFWTFQVRQRYSRNIQRIARDQYRGG